MDLADGVIALYKGKRKGGTAYTARLAQDAGKYFVANFKAADDHRGGPFIEYFFRCRCIFHHVKLVTGSAITADLCRHGYQLLYFFLNQCFAIKR